MELEFRQAFKNFAAVTVHDFPLKEAEDR